MKKYASSFRLAILVVGAALTFAAYAQAASLPDSALIQPDALVKLLQSSQKPLVFQVGFEKLYQQAHIPGSEYFGPGSDFHSLQKLEDRLSKVSKNKSIVLYCGCCPWTHCPNVQPAYEAMRSWGFTNVKVLYIAQNFGADWVDKGYPTEKPQ